MPPLIFKQARFREQAELSTEAKYVQRILAEHLLTVPLKDKYPDYISSWQPSQNCYQKPKVQTGKPQDLANFEEI